MKKNRCLRLLSLTVLLTAGCLALSGCGEVNTDSSNIEALSRDSAALPEETLPPETFSPPLPEPSSTPEPTPTPEVIELTISAAGDVSLGILQIHGYAGTFREMYDQQGPAYFLQNVRDIFEEDDMTIVNFEGVLTESTELVEKQYNIKGDPAYIEILPLGSVEAVSFGNNHRMDYGKQGNDDTVTLFEEKGIPYAYDDKLGIYETKGLRIGFVSVNEVYDGKGVEVWLEKGIKSLKEEEVNLIIACCHWGIEREDYPEDYQTELGKNVSTGAQTWYWAAIPMSCRESRSTTAGLSSTVWEISALAATGIPRIRRP